MIDHLSASQLSRFTRCAEMWRRQYIEGDTVPVGAAAHIGQAVHKAAEINFRQKIQSHTDLPADVLQDAAVQEFIRSVRDEGIYFTPKQRQNVQQFLAQSQDMTARLADLYRREIAGRIQPVLVEYKKNLLLPKLDIPVRTILDVYTANGELHDLKTSSRRWTPEKAAESPQTTLYRESVRLACGSYPEHMYFDVMLKYAQPQVQVIETSRTRDDIASLSAQFNSMLSQIRAGRFEPYALGTWMCSPSLCSYWSTCQYAHGRKFYSDGGRSSSARQQSGTYSSGRKSTPSFSRSSQYSSPRQSGPSPSSGNWTLLKWSGIIAALLVLLSHCH